MPKDSGRRDLNTLAAKIVDQATDEDRGSENGHVRAGRQGGKKGGVARATKLSAKRRTEIARKAARARWNGGS